MEGIDEGSDREGEWVNSFEKRDLWEHRWRLNRGTSAGTAFALQKAKITLLL